MIKRAWLIAQLQDWFSTDNIKLKKDDGITILEKIEKEYEELKDIYSLEDVARMVADNGVRLCEKCNTIMIEGYVAHDGEEYYCSDECLYKDWTKEDWEEATKDDSSCYWTEWLAKEIENKYFIVYNSMDNAHDFGLLTQRELTFKEAIQEIRQDLPNELVAMDLSEEFEILEENLEAEIGNRFYRIVLKSTY
jgi:hypothetical protein